MGHAALEQIQLSLGHASILTTERYLGVRQDLADAPCDHLGLSMPQVCDRTAAARPADKDVSWNSLAAGEQKIRQLPSSSVSSASSFRPSRLEALPAALGCSVLRGLPTGPDVGQDAGVGIVIRRRVEAIRLENLTNDKDFSPLPLPRR